ncbi:MAG: peptide ABC transporter substrate-binding protein [Clostridiales bacterium]|jgi:peptide/nickel transport system substrate-binding protein|nr:peptide ABC transporter substrate-binding protein [Clostridiales bacterium]
MAKKFIAAIVMTALMSACSADPKSSEIEENENISSDMPEEDTLGAEEDSVPASAIKKPLTLSMRIPRDFNPLLNENESVDSVLKLIFEPLVTLDASLKPIGGLARSFDFAQDGLSVRVALREDAVWSDGSPITSQDVKYSLNVIKSAPESSLYKECAKNVKSCDVVDDSTVNITFDNVYGSQAYRLRFPVIPRHYYENMKKAISAEPVLPIGCGMYVMESYSVAKGAGLVVNELYFERKPEIRNINVIVADSETSLYAFNSGVIDCVDASMAELARISVGEANIVEYTNGFYEFIGFNFGSAVFSDARVRRAVALSVDIDEIIETAYLSQAKRAMSPISPESWLYEPNVVKLKPDIKQAATLLDEAGFKTPDAGGARTRQTAAGETRLSFDILVNEENIERLKIAQTLSDSLKKLNIETSIVSKPFFEYEDMIESGQYDLLAGGFIAPDFPDFAFAFSGEENIFRYKSAEMDEHISRIENAVNESVLKSAASEFQNFFAQELVCVSLAFRESALIADKRILGDLRAARGAPYANVNEWRLDE